MAITHTNRKGQVYYLHRGKTRTGKAMYFFSQQQEGDLADAIPEGYEVHEKPNAQVFLRKKVPTDIRPEEVAAVEAGLRAAGIDPFLVEVEKNAIVVHLPDQGRGDLTRIAEELTGGGFPLLRAGWLEDMQRQGSYSAMMRFVLADPEQRHFHAKRWCFRGGTGKLCSCRPCNARRSARTRSAVWGRRPCGPNRTTPSSGNRSRSGPGGSW